MASVAFILAIIALLISLFAIFLNLSVYLRARKMLKNASAQQQTPWTEKKEE